MLQILNAQIRRKLYKLWERYVSKQQQIKLSLVNISVCVCTQWLKSTVVSDNGFCSLHVLYM